MHFNFERMLVTLACQIKGALSIRIIALFGKFGTTCVLNRFEKFETVVNNFEVF